MTGLFSLVTRAQGAAGFLGAGANGLLDWLVSGFATDGPDTSAGNGAPGGEGEWHVGTADADGRGGAAGAVPVFDTRGGGWDGGEEEEEGGGEVIAGAEERAAGAARAGRGSGASSSRRAMAAHGGEGARSAQGHRAWRVSLQPAM